ncbi:MAG: heme-binding domain-containing protein [Phycisphaerae bacterium]|nr:heme-binding domain-containing protein [Phycisphaerae bacterium]MBT5382158.1 heme-binding domain-containing protein [Phycisphaerae bacterium]MBT5583619.1 heme-binding domain-containing protein [Phycisphaerae bacterium]MBT5657411.1 heme-binding domain-containing protein [Phycisphaerae bacterium]
MKIVKVIKWTAGVVVIATIGIQFIPVDRTNPPITETISAPPEVMAILNRACFDCHSNETAWPWYSYVAPVSWLVSKDVKEGREELNFSQWDSYTPSRAAHKIEECGEEVEEGEMPLWFYLPTHPEARLTQADVDTIVTWSKQ